MAKKIVVPPGQAHFRVKFLFKDTAIEVVGGSTPKGMISADVAYRIYKMILDDQGKTKVPDLDSIFGTTKPDDAVPEHPAYVTKGPR